MSATPPPVVKENSLNGSPRLRGNLGVFHLFFSVMAYNAPLVIVIGVIPVMVATGNGIATPIAFILAGLIIAAFAVGFTRMARVAPHPGAFYSYITAGLGKGVGLGSGFVAALGYFCCYTGTFAFGGTMFASLMTNTFNGPDFPWWIWAFLFWVTTGVFGYLKVSLSAKILAIFLLLELVVVAAYDLAVVLQGGGENGLSLEPLAHPEVWFAGSFGIALLFAIGMFGGFEVTALFRDEVRDPARTVPRATYAVIVVVVSLYASTSWFFISSSGVETVVELAGADPTGAIEASIQHFAGRFVLDAATVMAVTSTFAVLLASHNITARYIFNLSADGILHRSLSTVHARHGSPHRASVATSVTALSVMTPFVLLGIDPMSLYAALIGINSFTLIFAMFATNIAVAIFLNRMHHNAFTSWSRVVTPVFAGTGLLVGLVLAATNFPLLIGGSAVIASWLFVLIAGLFTLGVALAFRFRRTRPEVYARIGRQ